MTGAAILVSRGVTVLQAATAAYPWRSAAEDSMARRLLVVEDIFVIQGRGLVLAPGIIPKSDERYCAGDPIELRKPDGSTIATRIGGLEMLCPNPRGDVVVMLKEIAKTDVPIGTEVWSMGGAVAEK